MIDFQSDSEFDNQIVYRERTTAFHLEDPFTERFYYHRTRCFSNINHIYYGNQRFHFIESIVCLFLNNIQVTFY